MCLVKLGQLTLLKFTYVILVYYLELKLNISWLQSERHVSMCQGDICRVLVSPVILPLMCIEITHDDILNVT